MQVSKALGGSTKERTCNNRKRRIQVWKDMESTGRMCRREQVGKLKEMDPFTYQAANPPPPTNPARTAEKQMKTSRRSLMVHRLIADGAE